MAACLEGLCDEEKKTPDTPPKGQAAATWYHDKGIFWEEIYDH